MERLTSRGCQNISSGCSSNDAAFTTRDRPASAKIRSFSCAPKGKNFLSPPLAVIRPRRIVCSGYASGKRTGGTGIGQPGRTSGRRATGDLSRDRWPLRYAFLAGERPLRAAHQQGHGMVLEPSCRAGGSARSPCVISYVMRDPDGAMVALRPVRSCQPSEYDRCNSAGPRRMYQGYQGAYQRSKRSPVKISLQTRYLIDDLIQSDRNPPTADRSPCVSAR